MKKILVFWLCALLAAQAYCQDEPPSPLPTQTEWATQVSWFLPTEKVSKETRQQYTTTLLQHCQQLVASQKKQGKNRKFLQKIFRQTHQRFLTEYHSNTPFSSVFSTGKYDCVASTALFALVLEYVGYTYQLYETHNHVYLKVQTPEGAVLLETTNATQGFVKYTSEIQTIENSYHQILPQKGISLKELAGLQFYNEALSAMQAEHYQEGTLLLRKAQMLYQDSPRVERLHFLAKQLGK